MMPFAPTQLVVSLVTALKATMENPITVFAHLLKLDVLPIKNVAPTLSVFNPANASAHLHSSLTLEMFAEIHAKDLLAELTPNALQLIVN